MPADVGVPFSVENGVYRTPGRAPDPTALPLPHWRTLSAPLVHGVMLVVALVVAVALFNVLAPAYPSGADTRLVPLFDQLQDVAMLLVPGSFLLLLFTLVRRVVLSWAGMRGRMKVLYVASILVVQLMVAAGGLVAVVMLRGGIHLFEPTWKASFSGPGGRTAHLYREGFGCGYEVYVSDAFAFTAKKQSHVGRRSCEEPLPSVRWNPSGAIDLVDRDGKPLESQASPPFLLWGGGC